MQNLFMGCFKERGRCFVPTEWCENLFLFGLLGVKNSIRGDSVLWEEGHGQGHIIIRMWS